LAVLVIPTVCAALVVPVFWVANVRAVGPTVIVFATVCPVPVKLTFWGEPVALSVTLIEPVLVAAAVGLNVTLIEHVPLIASEAGQLLVCAKSRALGPAMAIELIVTA
jgi:hypothetical protein